MLKTKLGGPWLAQSLKRATLGLEVVSLSPTWSVEIILKNLLKIKDKNK